MSNHRLPRRAIRTITAAAACGLAVATALGCEKKAGEAAPAQPAAAPAATTATAKLAGSVAVVDLDLIMRKLSWDVERRGKEETAATELNNGLKGIIEQLTAILTKKREQTIAAGRLSPDQINKLNAGDFDSLPLKPDDLEDYKRTIRGVIELEQRAKQTHQQLAQKWQQEVVAMYQGVMREATRRVAQANGYNTVVNTGVVFYTDSSTDISEKVIDELKTAAPRIFPAPPQISMTVNMNEVRQATSQPATQPATKPAGR